MDFWLRRSLCRWLFVVGFLGVFVLVFVGVFVGVFVDVFLGVFVFCFVRLVANRGQLLHTSLSKIASESILGRV